MRSLAGIVILLLPALAWAQPKIEGWDKTRFGMTPAEVKGAYPTAASQSGNLGDGRSILVLERPAEGVLRAACYFTPGGKLHMIEVRLDTKDLGAIVARLAQKYGRPSQESWGDTYIWRAPGESLTTNRGSVVKDEGRVGLTYTILTVVRSEDRRRADPSKPPL